jgi:hypothetical protein
MKIFISVASYRDLELPKTLKDMINKSSGENELHFSVVSQDIPSKHPDLSFIENLHYTKIKYTEAKGAGYARKLAMAPYNGQDFYYQIDSHMRFAENWDKEMIDIYYQSTKLANTQKIILSQFPAPYEVHTDGKDFYITGDKNFWDEPSWTSVVNTWTGVWAGNREKIKNLSKPHKSHTVLAAYIFAPGYFVEEIPYDERICFMGEELCIAVRAYTRGWQIYAPNKMLSWHFYKREGQSKVWSGMDDDMRPVKWSEREAISQSVQKNILLAREEGIFGIGDQWLEYQKMIGIDFHEFYKEKINDRWNNGVIEQEITFGEEEDLRLTRYCLKDRHNECFAKDDICQCICHKEKK